MYIAARLPEQGDAAQGEVARTGPSRSGRSRSRHELRLLQLSRSLLALVSISKLADPLFPTSNDFSYDEFVLHIHWFSVGPESKLWSLVFGLYVYIYIVVITMYCHFECSLAFQDPDGLMPFIRR